MSLLGYEGFDHYNNSTGLVTYQANFKPFSTGFGGGSGTQGVWAPTGLGGNLIFGAGLLGGQYMRSQSSNIEFGVALGASYGRLIFGVRFRVENAIANQGNIVTFRSGGSRCCGIGYNSTGKIVFWRGSFSTVIATGATTSLAQNGWYYLESDITFATGATGAYNIRINGNTEISGSSVQTANVSATMDQFGLYYDGVTTNGVVIDWDDLYLLDPTAGGAPFNAFLGVCRVETLFPNTPDSLQFTAQTNLQYNLGPSQNSNSAFATGTLYFNPITPAEGGTITALITRLQANYTGNIQIAIYDSSGAGTLPGNLLATCTAPVTNPTGNSTFGSAPDITFNFTGQALAAGTKYWIGILTDTSSAQFYIFQNTVHPTQSRAYASGFPSVASGFTLNNANAIYLKSTYTGTSALNVNETIIDGDTTYNSAAATAQDTFGIGSLSTTPTTVFAVAVNAIMRADDVAAINAATVIKSGATTQAGASNQQNTIYQVNRDIYVNDPNTGVAWLPANVNAAKIGYKRI